MARYKIFCALYFFIVAVSGFGINDFSSRFIMERLLFDNKPNENIFFSPMSIMNALNLVYNGAKGDTKLQLGSLIGNDQEILKGFSKLYKKDPVLNMANKMWFDNTTNVLDSFKNAFPGSYRQGSFIKESKKMRNLINKWVEKKTDIKNFFSQDSINDMTRLVLVNTIKFKGIWKSPFDQKNTKIKSFNLENGNKKDIQMMRKNDHFRMIQDKNFQSLEIPYENDEFSMMVTIPGHGKQSIDDVIYQMGDSGFQHTFQRLKKLSGSKDNIAYRKTQYRSDIDLSLPKFTVEHKYDLKKILSQMDVTDLFTQGKADLSGITGDRSLYCSAAIHQAKIEVDEKGTKASAATGIGISFMSLPPQFTVNRPFVFHIVHRESGIILFAGVIKDLGK